MLKRYQSEVFKIVPAALDFGSHPTATIREGQCALPQNMIALKGPSKCRTSYFC